MNRFLKYVALSVLPALLSGCSEDPVDNGNQPLDPQKYITVETSTQPFTGNATRATLIDNTNISSLALFCAYTVQTPYADSWPWPDRCDFACGGNRKRRFFSQQPVISSIYGAGAKAVFKRREK